jgi:ribosomal protein S18 acetylase RimI-like enzyme
MMKVKPVNSESELISVRELFVEYAKSLEFDLSFQDFGKELEGLPGEYAPPSGQLLLAFYDWNVAGCVALRKISGETCEMKRLFVRSQFRGFGIGKALANAIIESACAMSYEKMRLDTVPSMRSAISLYCSLGFKEIAPYRYNPIQGAKFMELDLRRTKLPQGSRGPHPSTI